MPGMRQPIMSVLCGTLLSIDGNSAVLRLEPLS